MKINKAYIKKHKIKLSILTIVLIVYAFCLPSELFNEPTSTVVLSREDKLLGAKIAKDGQWRFPENNSVPEKFKTCLILFEDEHFYKHPGFNPVSIYKAFQQNRKAGKIVRGGSTLTQQVIRLSRKRTQRTYFEKFKEIILATRLELRESKEEILSLWANNAPFGGNVVGLEAASWRYFNRSPHNLSWAEAATLAILPNAPTLIYPGKNQEKLLKKRNRLLKKLLEKEIIDSLTYKLSIQEEIPSKPYAIPQITPHLLQKISKKQEGQLVKTTIAYDLQQQVNKVVKSHYTHLAQNEIYNAAILVLNVKTREVLTYVGNTPTTRDHQKDVDIIDKPRSTGSILKPFLYGAMLDNGDILQETLIPDIPTQIGTYKPENFNQDYAGAIPAKKALSRSLNIPAVKMLQTFGTDKLHDYLQQMNFTTMKQSANHYGLSLILGGAESNLWDLCKNYAAFASTINHYEGSMQYFSNEFCEPIYVYGEKVDFGKKQEEKNILNAASMYLTFESLKEVYRPGDDQNWQYFDSSKQIAWKTGTSFGFRDAWAIGTTQDYVVGVWVGNADGEGRPGLVGVQTAAPILFDVFDKLPKSKWFTAPYNEMVDIEVCTKSGYRATGICEDKKSMAIAVTGLRSEPCPYHRIVNLDQTEQFLVNTSCENADKIVQKSWFVLPPVLEHYYQEKHPLYKKLPDFKESCINTSEESIAFIYPKEQTKIYLPRDFNGKKNDVILKVAHTDHEATLFWYLNDTYLGKTQQFHEFALQPKEGKYTITVVDDHGNELKKVIEIKT
ncbi:penicillin-binding protein 1C [Pseudotenacibaculum sp. MALMAid0570]|uniref:penicillin-binding protein 1C n=1 Tax=Pseudotenacibaculum sp. MALMAid0570 TaxID=3143938 RepID=UPI0032DE3BF5